MSGHNKFSKIKRLKAKNDAQKGSAFTKLGKLIQTEAKKSNGDTNSPGLRAAIEKARSYDMPNDTIERAIKKATSADAKEMESVIYETYGPGGCAIMIEALTDSRNRTSGEIKHILSENGATLASPGSASWAFEKKSEGWEPKSSTTISEEDSLKLEKLIEDLENNEDVQEVYTNAE